MPVTTTSNAAYAVSLGIAALLATLNPWAVTGAAFGCFFFLSVSSLLKRWQRVQLLIFSWGVGWAAGEFWGGDGPPFSKEGLFYAMIASAFAAVIATAFYHIIDKNGDVPPWLKYVLDKIPVFKSRGGGE